ncbi:MAG: helix-turn-helix domain-containing protein [Chlorobium sp.]|nr:helix-turn-helix domain-containing protein [Chlorobium sp.]
MIGFSCIVVHFPHITELTYKMQDKKQHTVEIIFDGLMQFWKVKTLRELAEKLEVKEGTLNAWKSRGNIPKPELILNKCKGISAGWLLTGEGPISTGTKEDKEAPPASGVDYTEVEWMIRELQMLREMLEMSKALVAVLQRENASLLESASAPVKKKQQL